MPRVIGYQLYMIKNFIILCFYTFKLIYKLCSYKIVSAILVSSISGILPLFVLVINQDIINEIQQMQRPFSDILILIIIYFIISILQNIISNLNNYILNNLNNILQYGITRIMIEKCGSLSLEMLERTETYDTITRLEQEVAVKPYQTLQAIMSLFSSSMSLISASIIILSWDWKIEIILIALSILLFLGEIYIGNKEFSMKYNRSKQEREAWYISYLMTHDTAFKEIKSYNLKKYFIEKYKKVSKLFIKQDNQIQKYRSILNIVITLAQDIVSTILMIIVLGAVYAGQLMIGTALSYLNAVTLIETSTGSFAAGIYSIYNSNLYMGMLKDFLESHEGEELISGDDERIDHVNNIELKHVYFDYPGNENVLKDISLKINYGDRIAIVGRNGSGKSTLFKILSGLYEPKEGLHLVNGKDLKDCNISDYRSRTSVLFQDFLKYEGCLKDNVTISDINKDYNQQMVEQALNRANVDFLKTEQGYELNKVLGNWFDDGNQISGGQWQKVALARVYYKDADVYLLDEPSSALDVMAELNVFNSFFELSKEKIGIYITHRVKIAKNADRIIVMDNGEIAATGSHSDLLKNCKVYKALYDKEMMEEQNNILI